MLTPALTLVAFGLITDLATGSTCPRCLECHQDCEQRAPQPNSMRINSPFIVDRRSSAIRRAANHCWSSIAVTAARSHRYWIATRFGSSTVIAAKRVADAQIIANQSPYFTYILRRESSGTVWIRTALSCLYQAPV